MPELEKVNCSTPDLAEETARKLLSLLPECAGENGEVDLDKLRQCLSSKAIEGNVERYEFTWPGKRAAKAAASIATTKTLRPCREESVDYDATRNLYIEGDNLEVLKLLQTSYAGQVKMIYIDPPYNTGHDFVYRDRFSLTQKELDSEAGVFDEDGNRFEVNDSAEARYHSNWCSMMYPRLKLARNLLRDDGVIFISIDDNEVDNLRKICDEVFGAKNFICTFAWQKRYSPPPDTKDVGYTHETLVLYRKSDAYIMGLLPFTDEQVARYQNPDNDPRGPWMSADYTSRFTATERPSLYYPIIQPKTGKEIFPKATRVWANSKETHAKNVAENRLWWGEDGLNEVPRLKNYLSEIKQGSMPTTLLFHKDVGHTDEATKELRELIPEIKFTPKPTRLLRHLFHIANLSSDSLILDFFSGSATTAHAVMQLNAEDGGHRRFIMVQLPEPCAEDSEAAKAGYKNICEIGKERIRRAGKKIAEELAAKNAEIAKDNAQGELDLENPDNPDNPVNSVEKGIPDIGFRVLKLDSSSLLDVGVTTGEAAQETLALSRIPEDRSPEDLLFQMLLETRIPLSDPICTAKVGGNKVFFVGVDMGGSPSPATADAQERVPPDAGREDTRPPVGAPLVACLDPKAKMDTAFFLEIAKLKPEIAFFRDDAFADDSARTNLQQAFDQFSPGTSIKVI